MTKSHINDIHMLSNSVLALQRLSKFNNKWISGRLLTQLLISTELFPDNTLTERKLNIGILKIFPDIDSKRTTSVLMRRMKSTKNKRIYGYYFKNKISDVVDDSNWHKCLYDDYVAFLNDLSLNIRSILGFDRACKKNNDDNSQQSNDARRIFSMPPTVTPTQGEKRKIDRLFNNDLSQPMNSKQALTINLALNESKFNSQEAKLHFLGKKRFEEFKHSTFNVRKHIEVTINRLRYGYLCSHGWKTIIYDPDDDVDTDSISFASIFQIQQKSRYVSVFLLLCLKFYETESMIKIAERAISHINEFDLNNSFQYEDTSTILDECSIKDPSCTAIKK